ncbi:hypothetical protein STEG23_015958, partial [Scotinomys teguina]
CYRLRFQISGPLYLHASSVELCYPNIVGQIGIYCLTLFCLTIGQKLYLSTNRSNTYSQKHIPQQCGLVRFIDNESQLALKSIDD